MCKVLEEHFPLWSGAIVGAAELDALYSLAQASRGEGSGEAMCRPVLLRHRAPGESAQLCVRGMRHPYLFRDRGQRCVPVSRECGAFDMLQFRLSLRRVGFGLKPTTV